jgi:hypothetical protein
MRTASWRMGLAVSALPLLVAGPACAENFEVDYKPPAAGASVTVSAPDPTSTPIVINVLIDGVSSKAAVLASGWYRYKAIVADGARNAKIAQNPKSIALPSEAEFLVPLDKTVILTAGSHAEAVGTNIQTCTIPFIFKPRDGYRYIARWKMTSDGCLFGVSEKALEPADAPEVSLVSLPKPDGTK